MTDEFKKLFLTFLATPSQGLLEGLINAAHAQNTKKVLSGEAFFKMSNKINTNKLSVPFECLMKILNLDLEISGSQMAQDVQVRKIKLFLKCQNTDKLPELKERFSAECATLSKMSQKNFKSQKEINFVNETLQYLTDTEHEKFCHDILHPNPPIVCKNVALTLLELDSWSLSQQYETDPHIMNSFLKGYKSYLTKSFPQHISFIQAENDKNFNFYFTNEAFAKTCEIILRQQLDGRTKKGNLGVRTKVFDQIFRVIYEKQRLELGISSPPLCAAPLKASPSKL